MFLPICHFILIMSISFILSDAISTQYYFVYEIAMTYPIVAISSFYYYVCVKPVAETLNSTPAIKRERKMT